MKVLTAELVIFHVEPLANDGFGLLVEGVSAG